jgi:hypothetical protein
MINERCARVRCRERNEGGWRESECLKSGDDGDGDGRGRPTASPVAVRRLSRDRASVLRATRRPMDGHGKDQILSNV